MAQGEGVLQNKEQIINGLNSSAMISTEKIGLRSLTISLMSCYVRVNDIHKMIATE